MAALEGKTVIIVGGTTGLGLSAARACAHEGARLVVIGKDAESSAAAEAELREAASVMTGDAQEPATIDLAIDVAVQRFGRVDGLYHVAGGSGRAMGDGPLHEISDGGWDATLRLNMTSMFLSNRAAVRQFMRQNSPGVVLNMGSVLGFSPSPHFFATHAYAAAKAAAVGFTRSCAAYYAGWNIRFNVIAPALVETPMSRRAVENPAIRDYLHTRQPLNGGRIGLPQDLDGAAVFLLSDAARYITGQVLAVDGGWCLSDGQIPEVS
jgi:NAD(P)-dependent dehydrogenase (short-subunit alcohol dehydrogenase family)